MIAIKFLPQEEICLQREDIMLFLLSLFTGISFKLDKFPGVIFKIILPKTTLNHHDFPSNLFCDLRLNDQFE